MAHHQQSNHDRMLATQGLSSGSFRSSAGTSTTGDDELASDVDEPPDKRIQFAKLQTPSVRNLDADLRHDNASPHFLGDRKESLLTQALLSSPELHPMSDIEAPVLTSDGGLTSPARTTTPSPPLPSAHTGLRLPTAEDHLHEGAVQMPTTRHIFSATSDVVSHETNVEAGLGRKRCITFACGRQPSAQESSERAAKTQVAKEAAANTLSPPKRPCMLKFVCPMRPYHTDAEKKGNWAKSPSSDRNSNFSTAGVTSVDTIPDTSAQARRGSDSTIKSSSPKSVSLPAPPFQPRKGKVFNRIDFQKSEATRFHEFACSSTAEDEWTNEQTAYRQKITVNDTLRKENAIRKLAEEAEEEALDEEAEEDIADDANADDDLSDGYDGQISDDGNETDDEEGFADSDDESDDGSEYQFWTPGLTTAATSTDHLDHIRPSAHDAASDSSIESTINVGRKNNSRVLAGSHARSLRARPGTPGLPDSSDFVVGTVDEDRPLEEAYMSCIEERRRSKHNPIPQDIDPSFPRSDPEGKNDEEEEGEESDTSQVNDTHEWVMRSEATSEDGNTPARKISTSDNAMKPLMLSPKRMLSPAPKGTSVHRSPPPRRLFGHCSHRLRSPPPTHRKLSSPPSSRRPSLSGSPPKVRMGIDMPHLAQRPNLTHTTSLPRTPNPFWGQHRRSHFHSSDPASIGTSPESMGTKRKDAHSRGPIDIVQGLETKRQRRKDKFWRQQCRAAGREKHRRCQPGKGAERMKELGLEMADRLRGYGQKAQLVLSV